MAEWLKKKKEKRKKSLPVIQMWQELRVSSLDPENPLEKEMATHYSILAGIIQWTEEPGGQRVGHD